MCMCMCVCVWGGVSLKNSSPDVYTYTCIHTCTHTCIYTHAQTHAYTHMHTHICRHTHADTHAYMLTHTHGHACIHMHTCVHTHVWRSVHAASIPGQLLCYLLALQIPLSLPSTSAQPLLLASLMGMCLCASPSISCDIMAVKKSVYTPTTLLVCLSHVQPAVYRQQRVQAGPRQGPSNVAAEDMGTSLA